MGNFRLTRSKLFQFSGNYKTYGNSHKSHPFGVAALIIKVGGDEDQAIAGLLHDVAEDCGGEPRLVEIAEKFGDRVAHIVRGCSDSLVVFYQLQTTEYQF